MVKIRQIAETDLKQLATVYIETYKIADPVAKWTKEKVNIFLRYWFNRKPNIALLAEINGKIVGGFIVDVAPWWNGHYLNDGELFVHPDYQSQGIGTELMRQIMLIAQKKYGITEYSFYTFKNYKFPLNWYKKIGIKESQKWIKVTGNVQEILSKL